MIDEHGDLPIRRHHGVDVAQRCQQCGRDVVHGGRGFVSEGELGRKEDTDRFGELTRRSAARSRGGRCRLVEDENPHAGIDNHSCEHHQARRVQNRMRDEIGPIREPLAPNPAHRRLAGAECLGDRACRPPPLRWSLQRHTQDCAMEAVPGLGGTTRSRQVLEPPHTVRAESGPPLHHRVARDANGASNCGYRLLLARENDTGAQRQRLWGARRRHQALECTAFRLGQWHVSAPFLAVSRCGDPPASDLIGPAAGTPPRHSFSPIQSTHK
ncbi:hypothetical protein M2275_002632 [Rhodococcus opacus]|nr:hypothetical protein [Rhodococcus opacus]